MYDYITVDSGLFGAVCANKLEELDKKVLVIEERNHIGGSAYTEGYGGIQIHKYDAYISHTSGKYVWGYANDLVEFNRFTNSPLAIYKDKLFNLPFNMNTLHQVWRVKDPQEAQNIINVQRKKYGDKVPENSEEQAISLIGEDLYQALIKGHTEKQRGRNTKELPVFTIKRIPMRFTFGNSYFSGRYRGTPVGGYTKLIEKMFEDADAKLDINFLKDKDSLASRVHRIIYTGPIDQYFDYRLGALKYRSLKFETERHEFPNFQGNAVINFVDTNIPYTGIIERKRFDYVETKHTVVTREYLLEWEVDDEPYYPVNDNKNMELFKKYRESASREDKVILDGRLIEYKYYDTHQVISAALYQVENIMGMD